MHRWQRKWRVIASTLLLAALTPVAMMQVFETKALPVDGKGESMMRDAYAHVYRGVTDAMYADLGVAVSNEQWETELKPSTKSVRELAQRYALRFVTTGTVLDEPPHEPGYKDFDRTSLYERLVLLLRCGYEGADGQHHVYRNLEHAAALDPEIHQLCFLMLNFKTYRAVWMALKRFCPAIYCGLVKDKKVRNRARTQVRACIQSMLQMQLSAVHDAVNIAASYKGCVVRACVQQGLCTVCSVN